MLPLLGKKLMILGASWRQVQEIKMAKDLGCIVYAVDQDPRAEGFKYADKGYVVSTLDIKGVLTLAKKLAIDGIMTLSDQPMLTVATVGEILKLPTISIDTAVKATNKAIMRETLKKAGVPIPRFHIVDNFEEYKMCIKNFEMPFIVKPIDNCGSRGVFLVKQRDMIEYAFDYSKSYSRSGKILVEAYVGGEEVSVETLAIEGITHIIAITDKITTGAPYFVELGHTIPSNLSEDTLQQIKIVTLKAHKALGISKGPAHTEIKIDTEGPKIIEIGARLGGDHITSDLVPLATGVNMIEACIYAALDRPYQLTVCGNMAAAVRFVANKTGKIKAIKGIEEARGTQQVEKIYQYKQVGEVAEGIKNSTDRVLGIITKGDDPKTCGENCDIAKAKIAVEYE